MNNVEANQLQKPYECVNFTGQCLIGMHEQDTKKLDQLDIGIVRHTFTNTLIEQSYFVLKTACKKMQPQIKYLPPKQLAFMIVQCSFTTPVFTGRSGNATDCPEILLIMLHDMGFACQIPNVPSLRCPCTSQDILGHPSYWEEPK